MFFRRPDLFSNQVARFASEWNAAEVTARLKAIEKEAGRRPEDKSREIVRLDIDLLSCDDITFKPEDLNRDYISRGMKELEQLK